VHKVDHPQYHPTVFKIVYRPDIGHISANLKQEWRGGAKVRKR
jgi:hypothetical protein